MSWLLAINFLLFTHPLSLARGADAKKLQLMGHVFEPVFGGYALIQFVLETLFELDDLRTPRANQMVVVRARPLGDKFKPGDAVAEIKLLYHAHVFQQMHGPINGCQITMPGRQSGKDFFVRQWVRTFAEEVEDGLAWPGDFAGLSAQTVGQG
jgi:hypothetical protein